VLATARNLAMEPPHVGAAAAAIGGVPDEALLLNDVVFCAADVLELVLQKRRQCMSQACALDWDPGQIAYDRWVLHSMSGRCVVRNLSPPHAERLRVGTSKPHPSSSTGSMARTNIRSTYRSCCKTTRPAVRASRPGIRSR
jgi:hypothetical protein